MLYSDRFFAPQRFSSTAFDDDRALFCELDDARNLYVFNGEYMLLGVAHLGLGQVFPSAPADELYLWGCDTDTSGNIYVALGESIRSGRDGFLIKFSRSLSEVLWVTPRMTASSPPHFTNGRLFTAHGGTGVDDYLFEIDPATGRVIGREPVPTEIEITLSYGNSLLVSGYDYGYIIQLEGAAHGALSDEGTRAQVADSGSWTFSVMGPQLVNPFYPEHGEISGVFHAGIASPGDQAAKSNGPQGLSFWCGGAHQSEYLEYFEGTGPTRPYELDVVIWDDVLPVDWNEIPARRDDIVLVSGNVHFGLGEIEANAMAGGWRTSIPIIDPMIQALLSGGSLDVMAYRLVEASYGGEGLAEGLAAVIRYCDVHWARKGHSVPIDAMGLIADLRRKVAPAPVAPGAPSLVSHALEEAVEVWCGGPANIDMDFIYEGDFDRDGLTDLVLNWSGVTCTTGERAGQHAGGQCGTANCLHQVFVSSTITAGEGPIDIFAIGVDFSSEQPQDLILIGDNVACITAGLGGGGCKFRLRWDGADFVRVD